MCTSRIWVDHKFSWGFCRERNCPYWKNLGFLKIVNSWNFWNRQLYTNRTIFDGFIANFLKCYNSNLIQMPWYVLNGLRLHILILHPTLAWLDTVDKLRVICFNKFPTCSKTINRTWLLSCFVHWLGMVLF